MILYYGADSKVVAPEYLKGSPRNDYGLGFYMTPEQDKAKIWASKFKNGGYVIKYEVNLDDLDILRINDDNEESILKWATLLIRHRFDIKTRDDYKNTIDFLQGNFPIQLDYVDFIIGYRADDSYFAYMNAFVKNNLSIEILSKAMKLGHLGLQYVAISKKAFSKIKFLSMEYVEPSDEYAKFQRKIEQEYRTLVKEDKITNTFIRDIMRKYEKNVWV